MTQLKVYEHTSATWTKARHNLVVGSPGIQKPPEPSEGDDGLVDVGVFEDTVEACDSDYLVEGAVGCTDAYVDFEAISLVREAFDTNELGCGVVMKVGSEEIDDGSELL